MGDVVYDGLFVVEIGLGVFFGCYFEDDVVEGLNVNGIKVVWVFVFDYFGRYVYGCFSYGFVGFCVGDVLYECLVLVSD